VFVVVVVVATSCLLLRILRTAAPFRALSSSRCPVYFIDPSVMAFLRFQCDDEDLEEFHGGG